MGGCAGVDWAKDEHAVLVADGQGEVIVERSFVHDEEGIAALCRLLVGLEVERVALERPDGLLVERLLDAGLCVLALHPNQVKAARPRFRSQGKSDRFDAWVLCELARTDGHRFRALTPDSDATKTLRALTRARDDLVATRVGLANQLRAELERFWLGAGTLFADVDSQIALAFLERYPSPRDARGLGEKRLGAFLSRHGYCGRRTSAQLLGRLRAAPEGRAGELETEARRGIVLALVASLRPLVSRISELEREIAHALRCHPDGAIFRSLFRDPKSVITAAALLAEIGDSRLRYPSPEALAADGGMSAVAVESGKRKHAAFRWACDKRLRNALATLANTSRHHNAWAGDLYAGARGRGHDHQRAIRTVGRAWSRVLWRMWQDRRPYDPTRHRALQRQLALEG
ncbi:MAG: IS110 family transposase [Actinomycetota bacterium]|nr:IS110 family transposase [Actinomycetota bacterium]MDQ3647492.1 IS110 family transposase [Actinomycetota bacterium]